MKFTKLLALLLALLLLVSCNEGNDITDKNNNDNTSDEGNDTTDKGDSNVETVKKDPILKPVEEAYNVNNFVFCESDNGMPYRYYAPDDYSDEYAYPVVLFLHGAGERGIDNEAPLIHVLQDWFNDLESPIYQSIIIVPQCPEEEQWVNTPWEQGSYDSDAVGESSAIKEALSILDQVCQEDSVNLDRIYVVGLSMGGYGTWNLLMNHSDIFASGMPICGGADPSKAEIVKDIPIYTFHGDKDSVVPVAGTREMVAAIRDAGGEKITYEEVPDVDHNVWSYAASRGDILRLMFEQRRTNK